MGLYNLIRYNKRCVGVRVSADLVEEAGLHGLGGQHAANTTPTIRADSGGAGVARELHVVTEPPELERRHLGKKQGVS